MFFAHIPIVFDVFIVQKFSCEAFGSTFFKMKILEVWLLDNTLPDECGLVLGCSIVVIRFLDLSFLTPPFDTR